MYMSFNRWYNPIKATAALLLAGFEPHVGSRDFLSIPHFRAKKGAVALKRNAAATF
jgi:hypothetical protein